MQIVLCAGKRKFNTITANYITAMQKAHITTSKYNNDINISTLKDDVESFAKIIANKQRNSHAIGFLRKNNKACIHNAEVDTIELPSHFTKSHLC